MLYNLDFIDIETMVSLSYIHFSVLTNTVLHNNQEIQTYNIPTHFGYLLNRIPVLSAY